MIGGINMRESGILLPVSALPSKHGIGKLGQAAYDFVDFLSGTGCRYWQVLPLSPTGYGDSPYQSCSAFAGNPYLIDFDLLAKKGWLCAADYEGLTWDSDPDTIDYALLYQQVMPVLRIAYQNFVRRKPTGFKKFYAQSRDWLDDYALFMAIKQAHDGKAWTEWEPELAMHERSAVAEAKRVYQDEIRFYCFVQY